MPTNYKALLNEKESSGSGSGSHSVVTFASSPGSERPDRYSSPSPVRPSLTPSPSYSRPPRWRLVSAPMVAMLLINISFLCYWHNRLEDGIAESLRASSSMHSESEGTASPIYAFTNSSRSENARESFLNSSLSVSSSSSRSAPTSCEVCLYAPESDVCSYGLDNIRLSRAYTGSGTRVRKFLEKALRGEKVKIGIIGASVSQGHSVPFGDRRWQDVFFEDFEQMFPNAELYQGAIVPAMNSRFFSYCAEALLPGDMDLYLVELDINNEPYDATLVDDDALLRGLLQHPNEPAVIRLAVFSLIFAELARGSMSTLSQAQWFDVPVISIRPQLLDHLLRDREAAELYMGVNEGVRNYRHIGGPPHRMLGDMLSLFLQEQLCETKRRQINPPKPILKGSLWPPDEEKGDVPPLYLWSSWPHNVKPTPLSPTCNTVFSQYSPFMPLTKTDDWTFEEWNDKKAWASQVPGGLISFKFSGTKAGAFVWKTRGIGEAHGPGQASCTIDGGAPIVINTHWDREAAQPDFVELADNLEFGEHVLRCEILDTTTSGGHKWRIQGVASL